MQAHADSDGAAVEGRGHSGHGVRDEDGKVSQYLRWVLAVLGLLLLLLLCLVVSLGLLLVGFGLVLVLALSLGLLLLLLLLGLGRALGRLAAAVAVCGLGQREARGDHVGIADGLHL